MMIQLMLLRAWRSQCLQTRRRRTSLPAREVRDLSRRLAGAQALPRLL